MPIEIKHSHSSDKLVGFEVVSTWIETNRDRTRKQADMILSMSGILFSATLGFLLFAIEKFDTQIRRPISIIFAIAIVIFIVSAIQSVRSGMLVKSYTISTQSKAIFDLSEAYNNELRIVRTAYRLLISGMIVDGLATGVFIWWAVFR